MPAKPFSGKELVIANSDDRPSVSTPIRMRHYGPVIWDMNGANKPFTIEEFVATIMDMEKEARAAEIRRLGELLESAP